LNGLLNANAIQIHGYIKAISPIFSSKKKNKKLYLVQVYRYLVLICQALKLILARKGSLFFLIEWISEGCGSKRSYFEIGAYFIFSGVNMSVIKARGSSYAAWEITDKTTIFKSENKV
jgi:hypothetical protein